MLRGAEAVLVDLLSEKWVATTKHPTHARVTLGLLLCRIAATMGNLTPTSLWSRTEYESRGLGARLGSFKPKQSNEDSVKKIESSMSAKMGRLLQSAKANFLQDSREGKNQKAAAEAPQPPRTRLSDGASSSRGGVSSLSSASETAVTRGDYDDALRFAPDGSSRGRRRLLAEDSMGLVPGDRVVLVAPPQSALFDKVQTISATGGLTTTTFDRGNSTCVQLSGIVAANPSGMSILHDLHSEADRIDLILKGAGFSVSIDRYSEAPLEVKFTHVFHSDVEVYDMNMRGHPPRDFNSLLPHKTGEGRVLTGSGVLGNYASMFDHLIDEVKFDANASLRLDSTYRSLKDKIASKRPPVGPVDVSTPLCPAELATAIDHEILERGVPFAKELDAAIQSECDMHVNWTSPEEPIVDWSTCFVSMKEALPLRWASFGDKTEDKVKFLLCVSAIRGHNPHLLPMLASIPAMAKESQGQTANSAEFERQMRFSVGETYVYNFFRDRFVEFRTLQGELLENESYLELACDNFQKYLKLKTQRGGQSSAAQEGTVRVAVKTRVQVWPVGTVLVSIGYGGAPAGEFAVVSSAPSADFHSCTYYVQEVGGISFRSIVIPSLGWSPKSVPGLPSHPPLSYVSQDITLPLGLTTYDDSSMSRIFDGPPSVGVPSRSMTSTEYRSECVQVRGFRALRKLASTEGLFRGKPPQGGQARVVLLLGGCRNDLMVTGHQKAAVNQWNPGSTLVSSVEILAVSEHRETSKAESANVVTEFLLFIGMLKLDGGLLVAGNNSELRRIGITGDYEAGTYRPTLQSEHGVERARNFESL